MNTTLYRTCGNVTSRLQGGAIQMGRTATLCFATMLLTALSATAAVTITGATGGAAISADTTGGTYTALTGPVLTEGAPANIAAGTIILNAPPGFIFNTGVTPNAKVTGDTGNSNKTINHVGNGNTFNATSVTTTAITFTINQTSSSTAGSLTFQNIQVRPASGTPLASGIITNSGTAVLNGSPANNYGTLTEVAGASTKLAFGQPPTSASMNASITPAVTVLVQDQFGNTTTSTASITNAIGSNPAGGTLSGTKNVAAVSGTATFANLSINKVGNGYTLTATSGALTSATSSSFNITKGNSSTSVSSSVNPSVSGQSVTFTATVAAVAPATGTPTGTVTFKEGTTTLGTGTLSGGSATFLTGALSVASHSITAEYAGDSNFLPSTNSSALTQTVNKANTTTSVVSSQNPSVFGQSVTFTATVSITAPGAGTVSGTVTFKDGAATLGTGTISGGQATYTTSALSVASHSITAVYGGDGNFNTSTSSTLTQTVNKAGTTTALSSSANPAVSGQSVTFTATVTATSPGAGSPSGTVTFSDGATTLGTGTISGGVATYTTSALSTASHSITASYGGDGSFNTSSSSAVSQAVNADDTATAVSSSANPSVSGQSVHFTATVTANSPGSGTPSGTVQFKVDGSDFGSSVTLSSGSATSGSTSSLSVSGHTVTAVYSGDSSFNTSTSSALSQTVNKADTSTSLSSSANPSVSGQSVTFTATVTVTSPGSGTPLGTVTFKNGANVLCSYTLTSGDNGTATCTQSGLDLGTNSITAEYGGDSNYNVSTSSSLSQVVNKPDTTTALTSSVNPSTYGQSVTFTATVMINAPGSGTPEGTVTFTEGSTTLGTATLDTNGVGTFTTSSLARGVHTVTATFVSPKCNLSVSPGLPQTVGPAAETVTVSSSVNPSIVNQSVYFTATVPTVSGGVTPTGTVQFIVDSAYVGSPMTLSNGTATSYDVPWLTEGNHNVEADYSGDSNYAAATNTLTQTVTAPLATCTASNNGPVCDGGTLQLSATTTDTGSGVYYSWSGPNGFTSTNQNPTISNVTINDAGTYWLTTGTTGTTNCIEMTVVSVAPALTASVTADTLCAGSSGNITANAGGGTGPYSYVWSPGGATTQTISVSDGGLYTVTVTDSTGTSHCSVQASGALTIKPLPVVSVTGANTVCPSSTNIYSAPAGMTSYAWSVSGAATIDGAADAQTVSVVATAGCNTNFGLSLTVVSDGCANGYFTNVNVVDTTAPSITSIPADATVSCANAVPAVDDNAVVVTDDCSTVTVTHLADSVTSSNCANNFTITRTYVATDACGNSSSSSQTISVHDTNGPVISAFPADATYSCSGAVPAADDGSVTATDGCGGSVTVTHADDVVTPGSCANRFTIARTYTATDACGNATTQTQNITVNDSTAPVLANVPSDVTVQCDAIPSPGNPTATDNCDNNPTISFNESAAPGSCAGSSTITRTWTATDACGNSSSATQTITVIDTTAPVLAGVPADVTTQCDSVPTAATPTATDNCDTNATITFNQTTAAGSCAGSYTLTRTWTATDVCGNSSSGTQHITVVDTTAPTLAGVPSDTTVQCDAVPTAVSPTVTDNCDTNATVSLNEVRADGSCPNSYTLTRTWTATDACGNTSTAAQVVTVIDTTAPVIAGVPADATVQCDAVPTAATATVTDNCDTNATISLNETSAPGSCANSYVLTRTWTATDACGNTSTAAQVITVIDTTAPALVGVPSDTTVQCDAVPTVPTLTATDNCDTNATVSFNETPAPGACAGSFTLTRVWTATDACGNTSSGTQVITVIDTTAPVLAGVPADATAQCSSIPTAATPTATDNCDSNPSVSLNETTAAGSCAGSFVLTRVWTATDACGNTSTAAQQITVIDTTAPVLAGVPADVTAQCDNVPAAATPTATDNCDTNAAISFNQTSAAGSCAGSYVLTRTWTATDVCGNSSSATQTITVIDTTAPTLAGVPSDTTVQCDVVPTAASPTVTDNCDTNATVSLNEIRADGSCSNSYVLTRTWTATDACGNTSTAAQVITVIDTTAPVIAGVPLDATVQCDMVPTAAAATVTDNCDTNATISFNETSAAGSCSNSYVLTRTWTATDACGNTSTAAQVITVIDTTAPVLAGAPSDITVQCDSVPTAATLTATDNCDSAPVISLDETTANGSVVGQFVITRTWTATDACGNTSTAAQHITAFDSVAPTLAGVPGDATVECSAVPSAATPTASDNCDPHPTVSLAENTVAGSCANSYVLTRTWTATDASGNSSSATQTITVHDTTAPAIVGVPSDTTVQCDAVPTTPTLTATDNCDTNAAVSFNEVRADGSCSNSYTLTRTWTATDACGNTSTAAQTITVIDTTAPVIAGVPADATVQCDAVPTAASATATDGCDSNPTLSFNESTAAGSCAGNYVITRTWTASDACGNTSTKTQTITVHDTTAPVIAGVPADATVQCDIVPTAATPTATDNCDTNATISFNETSAPGLCANSYVLTRTWTATDACGNTSTAAQHITVIDTVAPVLAGIPASTTAQCSSIPTAATPTATDNCDSNPHISLNETTATGSCAGSYTMTRTWTATDACGNTSTASQVITVVDTTAPVLAGVPANTTAQCGSVPTAATPTATDNCDTNATISLNETTAAGSCAGSYTLTRTWTASDVCGNTSTASQTITVIDTTAPSLVGVPSSTTVQCDAVPTAQTLTATDNCDTNAAVTFNETKAAGSCTNSYVLTRTWTATDACGNSSSASQTITVIDTTAPVLAGIPANTTAQCSLIPSAATPTATDNCDTNPTVSLSQTTTAGSSANNYTITRTWTATDVCGNTSTAQQVITVVDSTAPVLAGVPANTTATCSSIPTAATPTATDNCDTNATVTLAETSTQTASGCSHDSYTITRTWTATDAAGNTSTAAQAITVTAVAPVITGFPADATYTCASSVPAANNSLVTAGDACGAAVTISHDADVVSGSNCANHYTITRTYHATSACGNVVSQSQTITIDDSTAPTITGFPSDATYTSTNQIPAANDSLVTATDNCGAGVTVTHSADQMVNVVDSHHFQVQRIYTATDACGNASSQTQTFTINSAATVNIAINGSLDVETNGNHWTFAGTASGDNPITSVRYSLNGAAAVSASGTANWTASVTLVPGTNSFAVYAVDNQNNQSAISNAVVFYATTNYIYIGVQDSPKKASILTATVTFSPAPMGHAAGAIPGAYGMKEKVELGKTYTVTVAAKKPWHRFVGWATNLTAPVFQTNPTLHFVADTKVTNIARFENGFAFYKGSYSGLFSESTFNPHSAGYVSISMPEIADATSLKYSAKVYTAGTKYSIGMSLGLFDLNGNSHIAVPGSSLVLDLSVDLTNHSDVITGTVSNTVEHWSAPVITYLNTAIRPNAANSAHFTMVMPAPANPAATSPIGWSYGAINRNSTMNIAVSGMLADGTAWTAVSGKPTASGKWPLFAQLYKKGLTASPNGVLYGWLQFGDPQGPTTTNLIWSRPHNPGDGGGTTLTYSAGFTNALEVISSSYNKSASPIMDWSSSANQGVAFVYDNVRAGVTNTVQISGTTFTPEATDHMHLHIIASSGIFYTPFSNFKDPNDGKLDKIGAVILQNQKMAPGFFFRTNAGAFLLEQP